MVEYSQPNTHKAFHVGHLRNATLGNTLCRIMELAGYDVQKANYIGDIGMHVIKCLWCYQRSIRARSRGFPSVAAGWVRSTPSPISGQLPRGCHQPVERTRQQRSGVRHDGRSDDEGALQEHEVGEDVAYLLGQIANKREIKDEAFYDDRTIPAFWPIVGRQLQVNLEMSRGEREKHDDVEDEVPPEEQYLEWIERWQRYRIAWTGGAGQGLA
jgi:arginyl-tRNA synthetase